MHNHTTMLDLSDNDVDQLTAELFNSSKIDLRSYAKSSLKRRFMRLSELYSFSSYDALMQYVSTITDVNQFIEAITVNTTEMFRDPSFWIVLRNEIIPQLNRHDSINIWHAGCSTGEEVISLQIMLEEMGIRHKVQTKASDINQAVIKFAQQGSYKTKHLALSQNNYQNAGGQSNLENYITLKDESTFTFNPKLLENVNFKSFDLVQDTSFKKFDLILCRNVLIYFDFALQESVLLKFINSSHKNAYIAIGKQESIINPTLLQHLQITNEAEKIYRLL